MPTASILRSFVLAAFAVLAVSAAPFCGTCFNGGPPPMAPNRLTLACTEPGSTISQILFASYGTPNTNSCPDYSKGACDASNTTQIVTRLCLGQHQCVVFPNTSTFGDPCFGTAKNLAVVVQCSAGSGSAVCSGAPAPPPYGAVVAADFSAPPSVRTAATPSLQVVSHKNLWRGAPQHDASFASLKALGAKMTRFVPWLPYPKNGVAELDPPSSDLCGPNIQGSQQVYPFTLQCGVGDFPAAKISRVKFASFGNPAGDCIHGYTAGSCAAPQAQTIVESACVGQNSCVLAPSMFSGLPPSCRTNWLSVAVECDGLPSGYLHTYWNFTLLDEFTLDYWAAVDGDTSSPVPNWSTPPNWLYLTTSWHYQDEYREPYGGYETGPSPANNLTALGDYYGRLLSWYTQGGFIDENGVLRRSGHRLNITTYEIYNEVDYEHGHTPQSYTKDYDAIVLGIRKHADPQGLIKYVGLSLPNIDSTATVLDFAQYFLNPANHDPAVRFGDTQNFIGYHSYPTNGPYSPADPTTLSNLFSYGDSFVDRVKAVDALIRTQSPQTKTYLDECGTDMDQMVSLPHYWAASGALFAYLFASVSALGGSTVQVGQSQLADGPGQEPSVAILDWTTGNGTARYGVNALLVARMGAGDAYYPTTVSAGGAAGNASLYAQALVAADGAVRVLLINKLFAPATVSLAIAGRPPGAACTVEWVDAETPMPFAKGPCGEDALGRPAVCLQQFATAIVTLD